MRSTARTKPSGIADFAISANGTLVHVVGGDAIGRTRTLVWVDRQGREEAIDAPAQAYGVVRLSPDETRAALDVRFEQGDVLIWNFVRRTLMQLTFDHGSDNPIWTPDGRRIVFQSNQNGTGNLSWQAADGTGSAERLTTSPIPQLPKAMSPDGTRILFTQIGARTAANDLHVLTIGGTPSTAALIETPFTKNDPAVSPDGRYLAYQSSESGNTEIFVQTFPKVDGGKWKVSASGGVQPQWARNGRELFFLDGDGYLTSAQVETNPTFAASAPRRILETRYVVGNGPWTYDVGKGRPVSDAERRQNRQRRAHLGQHRRDLELDRRAEAEGPWRQLALQRSCAINVPSSKYSPTAATVSETYRRRWLPAWLQRAECQNGVI